MPTRQSFFERIAVFGAKAKGGFIVVQVMEGQEPRKRDVDEMSNSIVEVITHHNKTKHRKIWMTMMTPLAQRTGWR